MVYVNFPVRLTDEEELLKQKYAKLRKKRKALQAARTVKPEKEAPVAAPAKRPAPESAVNAREQAKKLLKCGAIKIEADNQTKQNFKRSRNLDKKDAEKPLAVGFQPFSATHPEDEERESRPRPRMRGLYDNFVSGGYDRERGEDRRDREPPRKGNTIYVHGHGVSEDALRSLFSNMGTIININMEKDKNVGFVTFEKMESADAAIAELNGAMVEGKQLRVSMARRQPTFEQTSDASTSSWASIAASSSQKGSHKDKRDMVSYESEDLFN